MSPVLLWSLQGDTDGDADKAYIAGLLHDCAKELDASVQLELAESSDLDVCEIEKTAVPLFHAIAGSELVKTEFGITDKGDHSCNKVPYRCL